MNPHAKDPNRLLVVLTTVQKHTNLIGQLQNKWKNLISWKVWLNEIFNRGKGQLGLSLNQDTPSHPHKGVRASGRPQANQNLRKVTHTLKVWERLASHSPTKSSVRYSDVTGSKIFDPGWVGSAIYGLDLNLENFP